MGSLRRDVAFSIWFTTCSLLINCSGQYQCCSTSVVSYERWLKFAQSVLLSNYVNLVLIPNLHVVYQICNHYHHLFVSKT